MNMSLEEQVMHWEQKKEQLSDWLYANTTSHPDFQDNFRAYNNASNKVYQLGRRLNEKLEPIVTYSECGLGGMRMK